MGAFRFEGVAMTIVVGMREFDEAMLLAADSEANGEGPGALTRSLPRVDRPWRDGYTGNPT